MNSAKTTRVAIAGLGAVGKRIARSLDQGIPGCTLTAVASRDAKRADEFLGQLSQPVKWVPLGELVEHADMVIECVPPALLMSSLVEPVLRAGKKLVVLSVGALLDHMERCEELCRTGGGQILVPTGALLGLDALCAAAEGRIDSVRMVSRKPPIGFAGAPLIVEKKIDLASLKEPLKLYEGTTRQVAKDFPSNLNVAVALSLAGIGVDRTFIEVWADPGVERNTHRIDVESDAASFSMTIRNVPSENPKTGLITAQSVTAMLRKMNAPLRVGT
jgi:aspartate dehydrogenase